METLKISIAKIREMARSKGVHIPMKRKTQSK